MNTADQLLLDKIHALIRSHQDMIGEVTIQVLGGAEMGVQHVDSHVLLEICQKHNAILRDLFTPDEIAR